MNLRVREYAGLEDDAAMRSLAAQCAQSSLHWMDLPYRMSGWSFWQPGCTLLFEDTDGKLQAWASLQTPFWFIDLYALQEELLPEILARMDRQAVSLAHTPFGHPSWFVGVFEDQTRQMELLEQAGYVCQSFVEEDAWLKVWLSRELSAPLAAPHLPEGFVLRPLAGRSEVAAYVDLHRAAFGTNNMTESWRKAVLAQPGYQPELDLVVQAPDGRLAGFCIGWLGRSPGGELCGQVEPMGVHADFRRLGLGRALLVETFRRMAGLGVGRVYVECDGYPHGPDYLNYQAAGFALERRLLVYRKDFAAENS